MSLEVAPLLDWAERPKEVEATIQHIENNNLQRIISEQT
jgi:hypothetical protein